ncbi:MAG: ion transporter [Methanoregula sp.]|jgi:voltage-gated potassium channel
MPEGIAEPYGAFERTRRRIFNIIEDSPTPSVWAPRFNIFMTAVILLNIFIVVIESVESLYAVYGWIFELIDLFSVIIFTVEYALRIWTCTLHPKFQRTVSGRLRFAATPMAIVDLIAILPFYLPMFLPVDLRVLRMLRLMRLLRILKIGRYSASVKTFEKVLVKKKEEILLALAILLLVLVLASSLMYTVEHDAQPDKFADIPHSMWWGIVTLATVGYGDVYPITPLGQFLGAIVIVVGIGVFALPAGIFASGFVDVINEKHEAGYVCPYCGHRHDGEGNKLDPEDPPDTSLPENPADRKPPQH